VKVLITLFLLMLASSSSYAAEVPVGERSAISISRLALAAGAGYEFVSASGDTPAARPKHEWIVGLYGSYNLTPGINGYGRTSIVGSVQYPVDTKLTRSQIGVRVTLFQGR